ncbi:DNA-directed RNA polymerase subunit alpha [Candidatus Shapirobacteria bacterium]|nr:DNA-directed RNA polymerase subunit alpha [Candidatus Shapirobacteria bacterium]
MKVEFNLDEKKEGERVSHFIFSPLPEGFGHTLGNALRRLLLTAVKGRAITKIKVKGATHQFDMLRGVKEDLVEIILNFKKVRFVGEAKEPVKVKFNKKGPGEVKAGDLETPASLEVVNKDLVLAHLSDEKTVFSGEVTVEEGWGYSPAEPRHSATKGEIVIDAIFTPILKVNYSVEALPAGFGEEKLVMEITTDGTVAPREALKECASILIESLNQIITPNHNHQEGKKAPALPFLKTSVVELGLPTRTINALEKAGFKKVSDLVKVKPEDLSGVRNLGQKSIAAIREILKGQGVDWS